MYSVGIYKPEVMCLQNFMTIGQYHTEGVFRKHLAKYDIHVELRTELASVVQDDEGVTATLKNSDENGSEQVETIRVAYVIGADGARGMFVLFYPVSLGRQIEESIILSGITRKIIGATFEGETKDADGSVYADVVIEGLSSEVRSAFSLTPVDTNGLHCTYC